MALAGSGWAGGRATSNILNISERVRWVACLLNLSKTRLLESGSAGLSRA